MSHESSFRDTAEYREWTIDQLLNPEEEPQEVWLNDGLPYSDLREWIPEDSILPEIDAAFDTSRLSDIRSLSFLSYRVSLDEELYTIHDEFRHDRFDHSLVVGMVMDKILKRNKIAGREYALGMTAALTHDLATPAGGDAIKFIDPANLHEEDHWVEMLTDKSRAFLEKYSLSPEEVQGVIKNEGRLGEILDIADRLTYTMKDIQALIGGRRSPLFSQPAVDIERALVSDEQVGNLYRDILIDQESGRPYCNDPDRLAHFLTLRALMHHGLYMSPVSAGRDWVIAKFVEPFYTPNEPTPNRPLTPQLLRQWTDPQLMQFLSNQYRVSTFQDAFFYNELATWSPSSTSFSTVEEAEQEQKTMEEDPSITILDTVTRRGFSTGEDYLVKDDNGDIVTLKDAKPSKVKYLRAIAKATEGTHIFYINSSDQSKIGDLIREQRAAGRL